MTRNLEEEAKIEAIQNKKAESLRKKREYREGVTKRKEERAAKKDRKLAEKQARMAQLASLVSTTAKNRVST